MATYQELLQDPRAKELEAFAASGAKDTEIPDHLKQYSVERLSAGATEAQDETTRSLLVVKTLGEVSH